MLYQLPNGKTIYLTVDEFLDLTDQDVQMLMSVNAGEAINSPFYGSAIKGGAKRKKKEEEAEEEEVEDKSIDFQEEFDEPQHTGGSTEEGLPDDMPDIPDDMSAEAD
jgi:hypothetical protein